MTRYESLFDDSGTYWSVNVVRWFGRLETDVRCATWEGEEVGLSAEEMRAFGDALMRAAEVVGAEAAKVLDR